MPACRQAGHVAAERRGHGTHKIASDELLERVTGACLPQAGLAREFGDQLCRRKGAVCEAATASAGAGETPATQETAQVALQD